MSRQERNPQQNKPAEEANIPSTSSMLPAQIKLATSGPFIVIKTIPKSVSISDDSSSRVSTPEGMVIDQTQSLGFSGQKHSLPSDSPISKKRIKLEDTSSETLTTTDDLVSLKTEILNLKLQRLKALTER